MTGAPKCVNVGGFIDSFVKEHTIFKKKYFQYVKHIIRYNIKVNFHLELRIKCIIMFSIRKNSIGFDGLLHHFHKANNTKEWKSAHAQLHKNTNVSNNQNVK